MINIDTLLVFLFIFSILSTINIIFKFFVLILQNPPQKLILTLNETLYYGLCLSYIITFLIKH